MSANIVVLDKILFTGMEPMSLYSNVRGREAHSDQYGHNKLTCNEREQEDLASRRDSPSHYSVIVGSGHIFHFGNLKLKSIKTIV